MATKLVDNRSSIADTPFLVDSCSQAQRSDLEDTCSILIHSFIKMKDSQAVEVKSSQDPADFLLHPSRPKNPASCSPRGVTMSKSTDTKQTDHTGESSVDASDSSVDTTSLLRMVDEVHIGGSNVSSTDVSDLVPQTLPVNLRDNLSKVEEEDIKELYDIKTGVQRVKNGDLTTVELIVLHWRSYCNIVNYELSDMETLQSRFERYFGSIFADLMEVCFPDRGSRKVEEILTQEFQQFRQTQGTQGTSDTVTHVTANGRTL